MGILKGYVNKENNSNRIYSREDIGKMSPETFSKNEKAIDHQMRTVGVPTNDDLKNSSDVVYVHEYTRADGTKVSAYYRSKPDGTGSNNSSNKNPGDLVPNAEPHTGGDLVPDKNDNSIDKILDFLSGDYSGESTIPTNGKYPLGKAGSSDILSQILNLVPSGKTGNVKDAILQKIIGSSKTNNNNKNVLSNLWNVLQGGNTGGLDKILHPDESIVPWNKNTPDGTTTDKDFSPMGSLDSITNLLNFIKTGDFSVDNILSKMLENSGGIGNLDKLLPSNDKRSPWDEKLPDDVTNNPETNPLGNLDSLSELLNYIKTGEFNIDKILQTTGKNDSDKGYLDKILHPDESIVPWDEKIPDDKTSEPNINPLGSLDSISELLNLIKSGDFSVDNILSKIVNNDGFLGKNPDDQNKEKDNKDNENSKSDKEEEEQKGDPIKDLLNYAFTGEFNKDEFIDHLVRNTVSTRMFDGLNDPSIQKYAKMLKEGNEQVSRLLDSIVGLMPEDSKITDVAKSLVAMEKTMASNFEAMFDAKESKERMIAGVKQWVTDFSDFAEQLVTGGFKDIKWDELNSKLHLTEIATAINPIAGIVATLALDAAPKVVKLAEACNDGDKAEIIQEAIGAFSSCMGVIGQLKSAVGSKLAEFSKDVDAKIYNEATQTYDNLGKMQDAGYKYETYVKAEMFDQANQEAIKLNDLSKEVMQGEATGFASKLDNVSSFQDSLSNDLGKLNAQKDKFLIDRATEIGQHSEFLGNSSVKNSSDLWQYASQGKVFDKQNVQEFSSINNIKNPDLNQFIHEKVQGQLDLNDVKGLVFKPDSSLSNLIASNRDMHGFISDNYSKLKAGQTLQSSLKLDYRLDDWGALNKSDIYKAYIDKSGDFHAIVVDTYDFNKGESNFLVKAGRNVQEAGLLKPFYSVSFVDIKKADLDHIMNVYKVTKDMNLHKNTDLYYNLLKLKK